MTRSSRVTSKRELGGSLASALRRVGSTVGKLPHSGATSGSGVDRVGVVLLSQVGNNAPSGQATFMWRSQTRAEELMNSAFSTEVGTCHAGTAQAALPGSVAPGQGGNRLTAATLDLVTFGCAYGRLVRTGDRYPWRAQRSHSRPASAYVSGSTPCSPHSLTRA